LKITRFFYTFLALFGSIASTFSAESTKNHKLYTISQGMRGAQMSWERLSESKNWLTALKQQDIKAIRLDFQLEFARKIDDFKSNPKELISAWYAYCDRQTITYSQALEKLEDHLGKKKNLKGRSPAIITDIDENNFRLLILILKN
jgi:hypothetical protein